MTGSTFRYSILIADDDDAYRWTLREVLEPVGFRTLLASDGRQAIALVEEQSIDCALLDMHMPGLTGLETIQIVRQFRATLPCIMLTADRDEHLIQRAQLLNVFTVLLKPVTRELLTTTVQRALARSDRAS